jgi:hypothetical protein
MMNKVLYVSIGILYQWLIALVLVVFAFVYGDNSLVLDFDFIVWDAEHVEIIRNSGYDFPRSAFFPLFPLLWKLSGINAMGISIFNSVIFGVSAGWIAYKFRLRLFEFLLLLSLPSLLFMTLPYAEAIMFFLGTLYLVFMSKKMFLPELVCLFLMTLSKPTATVLIPTIILAEVFLRQEGRVDLRRILYSVSVILIATCCALYVQWIDTGDWTYFFQSQQAWGNYFRLPRLPLDTWNHNEVIWLDFASLLICVIAGIVLFSAFINKSLLKKVDKSTVYALFYLTGTGMFVLLFRGGDLFSLNRFVIATPYLFFAIHGLKSIVHDMRLRKFIFSVFVCGVLLSLCFGSYLHIRSLISYLLVLLFFILVLVSYYWKQRVYLNAIVLMLLITISVFFRYAILKGHWVS